MGWEPEGRHEWAFQVDGVRHEAVLEWNLRTSLMRWMIFGFAPKVRAFVDGRELSRFRHYALWRSALLPNCVVAYLFRMGDHNLRVFLQRGGDGLATLSIDGVVQDAEGQEPARGMTPTPSGMVPLGLTRATGGGILLATVSAGIPIISISVGDPIAGIVEALVFAPILFLYWKWATKALA